MTKLINSIKSVQNYIEEKKTCLRKKLPKFKRIMLGMKVSDGFVFKFAMYFLLIVIGFVFIYPLIYMFSTSMMSNIDLVDNTIRWIPSELHFDNYKFTYKALNLPTWDTLLPQFGMISSDGFKLSYLLPNSLYMSIFIAGISTLCLAAASAVIGYGLARYNFPFKKVIIFLMIFTFIMPKTLFFIPTNQLYTEMDRILRPILEGVGFTDPSIKKSLMPILLPALTGQGLQAAFFTLIFYQFFAMIPKPVEEAAIIDGAGAFKIFYKIALPMVAPAFIITFVYGFALYWNETFFLTVYSNGKYQSIPMLLENLESTYGGIVFESGGDASRAPDLSFTESKAFAGTLLSIVPLIFMYSIVQRWFVESIDKSGITGE
ncbi:carbohydrate ABC transporter permease [Haloplasma contractile]|uniref:Binding-protein-dependent transport systems inner membrane component n=1 Tax=Haloplasma contractile SSD-17B TaxID=1033810 RepID=U2FJS0_9MOLU|nr:carbohydrate ABC transporter permease [Haloplasma contractile]ERJ13060.1 Binding-protein-dependent transport systems inner membrane component [Haloplasma contractile SSD-17B]